MSEKSKFQIEFSKPGLNPFFSDMVSQKKTGLTPVQQLHSELRGLEKIAESGNLKAWQEKAPQVLALVETVHSDGIRRLEVQVEIKQLELTLFLKASKQALQQSEVESKRAKEAELVDNAPASREHWQRAQKLKRIGEHFQEQLQVQLSA